MERIVIVAVVLASIALLFRCLAKFFKGGGSGRSCCGGCSNSTGCMCEDKKNEH